MKKYKQSPIARDPRTKRNQKAFAATIGAANDLPTSTRDFKDRIRGIMKGAPADQREEARRKRSTAFLTTTHAPKGLYGNPKPVAVDEVAEGTRQYVSYAEFNRRFKTWQEGREPHGELLHSYLTSAIERRAGEIATVLMGQGTSATLSSMSTLVVAEARADALMGEFRALHQGSGAKHGFVEWKPAE